MLRPVWIVFTILLVPIAASGQVGIAFEFSLSNPGARSMGFGGAFVALADDATAAFANPAGLIQLVDSEVSLEVRRWSYANPYTYTGRITGEPTGIGLDTRTDLEPRHFENELSALSFISFVYPHKRWSIAAYRHLLADFRIDASTQGLFVEVPGRPFDTERLFDRRDSTDLELVTYGLSGAFKVVENLSLGLTLTYFDGLLQGRQERYLWDEDSAAGRFGPTSFLPERLVAASDFNTDGADLAFNAGVLWRVAPNWSIGGFYRRGPSFDFEFSITGGPASENVDLPPGERFEITTGIEYPSVLGAGVAYRSTDGRLTLSFEWDRVEYSNIFDSLNATSSDEFIADGNEYHLGGEYVFLRSEPLVALRAGVWLEPDHQVQSSLHDPIVDALLPAGSDEMHFAIGFGTAFKRVQFDLGADFSDRQDQISVSGIYNW